MVVTVEEAARFLAEAGVDVQAPDDSTLLLPRVQICRLLITLAHDTRLPPLRWDTPLHGLYPRYPGAPRPLLAEEMDDHVETACYAFGLSWHGSEGVITFGDLVFYIEGRLRDLWHTGAAPGCPSQTVFYELRRAVYGSRTGREQDGRANPGRVRPGTLLRDCLSSDATGALEQLLHDRFGIERVPISLCVFGRMEFGATWLALWFLAVLSLCITFGDTGLGFGWFFVSFFGAAVLIALALRLASRPTWTAGGETLGDLVRWTLAENAKVVDSIRRSVHSQ
jgi:hypothetical protein